MSYKLPTKDDILALFYKHPASINNLTLKLSGEYMSMHHSDNKDFEYWKNKTATFKEEISKIIQELLKESVIIERPIKIRNTSVNNETKEIDVDHIVYTLSQSLNEKYTNCKTHVEFEGKVAVIINGCYGGFGYSDLVYQCINKWNIDRPDVDMNYRTGPLYIVAVDLLKDKSRGNYSKPTIDWIPKEYFENQAYEISEYDGSEDIILKPERIITNLLDNFTLKEDSSREELFDFIQQLKTSWEKNKD
jgi:Txe/YoeB family toxin of Txe-Axe toxin-antitoxin module